MSDFLAALGLVFVIEGLIFAAFPDAAKRAMTSVLETPDISLRLIGIGSAISSGLIIVWLVRRIRANRVSHGIDWQCP